MDALLKWITERPRLSIGLALIVTSIGAGIYLYWFNGPYVRDIGDPKTTILVSSPTVFSRARLLNESISEENSLKNELTATDKYLGNITRSVTSNTNDQLRFGFGTADSAGTGNSKPAGNSQGTGQNGGGSGQGSNDTPDLFSAFQARESLRARIDAAIGANDFTDYQLDGGRGLFRLQFSAALLPHVEVEAAAHIEIGLEPPDLSMNDLVTLYSNLLALQSIRELPPADATKSPLQAPASKVSPSAGDRNVSHKTAKPNHRTQPAAPNNNPAQPDIVNNTVSFAQLGEFLLRKQIVRLVPVSRGVQPKDDLACDTLVSTFGDANKLATALGAGLVGDMNGTGLRNSAIVQPDCVTLTLALPYDFTLAATFAFNGMFAVVGVDPLSKSDATEAVLQVITKSTTRTPQLQQAFNNLLRLKQDSKMFCHYGWNLEAQDDRFRKLIADAGIQTGGGTIYDPRPMFEEAGIALKYDPEIQAIFDRMDDAVQLSADQKRVVHQIESEYDAYVARAKAFVDEVVRLQQAFQTDCQSRTPEFDPRVPDTFQDVISYAVNDGGSRKYRLKATARALRLRPQFVPVSERRDTSSGKDVGTKGGGTVGNHQISVEAGRNSSQTNLEFVTRASIIGYLGNRTGWVLEADQNARSGAAKWVQGEREELLAMDVDAPAWWPSITVRVTTSWTNPDSAEPVAGTYSSAFLNVPLPGAGRNSVDLEQYLASDTQLMSNEQDAKLIYPELSETNTQTQGDNSGSGCHPDGVLLIVRGSNLWHSPRVFMGDIEAQDVTVLPGMDGLVAKFPPSKAGIDASVPVFVATSTMFQPMGRIFVRNSGVCSPPPPNNAILNPAKPNPAATNHATQ